MLKIEITGTVDSGVSARVSASHHVHGANSPASTVEYHDDAGLCRRLTAGVSGGDALILSLARTHDLRAAEVEAVDTRTCRS
jgi:hypothetical protein